MKDNKDILPQNLHYILIGLMLGDGHIYKTSPTSNSRFEMSFGKDRELFAKWIGVLFKDYSNTGITRTIIKGNSSSSYYNFRLKTRTLPIFNFYHNIFYNANNETWKYKKIVPHNISNLMNSIVLANLIMSDGNFDKSRNRIRIYTNSFLKEEVEILSKSINSNLNIYVGVLHDRKDQWILTIGATQLNKLREILIPHFESSMLYRLGL
jgi:LAGLIDADG DNA endonuclease family